MEKYKKYQFTGLQTEVVWPYWGSKARAVFEELDQCKQQSLRQLESGFHSFVFLPTDQTWKMKPNIWQRLAFRALSSVFHISKQLV